MDTALVFLGGMTIFLLVVLVLLTLALILIPSRKRSYEPREESELDTIKHQIESEGEQEAMEELMPYKPPRLDAPRNRKRL